MYEKKSFSSKKIIITGATGLIGKETLAPLLNDGFEVYALTSKIPPNSLHINWIQCDLFNEAEIKKTFEEIKPQFLLHFAWITIGDFLTSNTNFKFVIASLNLLKYFGDNGGKRVVFVGTGTEYEFQDVPLSEYTPIEPKTIYAKCKNHLRELAELYSLQNNLSFVWGRVFNAIGYDDNKQRLTAYVIDNLLNNKEAIVNNGLLVRDYMYTKDLAQFFVKILESDITGSINVCSGEGVQLKDYVTKIAQKMNKSNLLKINNLLPANQAQIYVGDNTKLMQLINYKPQFSIDTAIDDILANIECNAVIERV